MKNVFKLFAIAIVALIGFSFVTCDLDKKEADNRPTPTAEDFTISGTGTFEYDASYKAVSVIAKWDKSTGAIKVKYNGVAAAPSAVDTYTVTFDVAETSTWKAAKDLSAGELIIGTPAPKLAHFDIKGIGTAYYDGNYKPATVTAQTGKTTGAITVYYEGTDYPKVDVAPADIGTYKVTFDVEVAEGWKEAVGMDAGTLTIADGTPSTPKGVSIAIQSLTSLKVSWTSVDRATSYKVFYITTDMDELELAGTATVNSFTHSGLTLNIDDIYYYYIIAVSDKYGESNYSDFKSIVIDKPVAPNSVRATASSAKKIDLQWSAVSGATSYKVFYNTTGYVDGTMGEVNDTYTSASASLTGATANTTYYFWIKAINPFGTSDYSTRGSAKTPMESNYNLGLYVSSYYDPTSAGGKGTLITRWNRVSASNGSINYYIYRSDGTPDNFRNIGSSMIPDYWDYNVYPNTRYYYYVIIRYSPYSSYGSDQEYMSEIISYTTGTYTPPAIPPTPPATTPPAASTPPTGGGTGDRKCPSKLCLNGTCISDGYVGTFYYFCRNGLKDCAVCKGQGTISGSGINSTTKLCTTCNATGKVKCYTCNGTGKCTVCKGTGKV